MTDDKYHQRFVHNIFHVFVHFSMDFPECEIRNEIVQAQQAERELYVICPEHI